MTKSKLTTTLNQIKNFLFEDKDNYKQEIENFLNYYYDNYDIFDQNIKLFLSNGKLDLIKSNFLSRIINDYLKELKEIGSITNSIGWIEYNNVINYEILTFNKKVFDKIFKFIFEKMEIKYFSLHDILSSLWMLEKFCEENKKEYIIQELIKLLFKKNENDLKKIILDLIWDFIVKRISKNSYNGNNWILRAFSCSTDTLLLITSILMKYDLEIDAVKKIEQINYLLKDKFKLPNFDVYSLINQGKEFLSNKIDLNIFYKQGNSFPLCDIIFYNSIIEDREKECLEMLGLIYIGYGKENDIFDRIEYKFDKFLFNKKDNILSNYSKSALLEEDKTWVLNLFHDSERASIYKKYEKFFSSVCQIDDLNNDFEKLKEYFWFEKEINCFLNKYYNLNKIFEFKLNYYWKSIIYIIFNNKEWILENKIDSLFYSFIFCLDFKATNEIRGKKIDDNFIYEINNSNYMKSIFKKDLSKLNIENVFSEYLKIQELDFVSDIVLASENMLSIVDIYKFTEKAYNGNLIYKMIIYDLFLDGVIFDIHINTLFSEVFKIKISSSLEISNHIQSNNNLLFCKPIFNLSLYFDVFIYEIYRIAGYKKIRKIVLDLIRENVSDLLVDQEELEQIKISNKEYKKYIFNFNNDFLYEKRKIDNDIFDEEIYNFEYDHYNEFTGEHDVEEEFLSSIFLMNELLNNFIQLKYFESDQAESKIYTFRNNSFKWNDNKHNDILWKIKNISKNSYIVFLYNLFRTFYEDFDTFSRDVEEMISLKK